MSYWSENPEACDEIVAKAIACKAVSYCGYDTSEQREDLEVGIEAFVANLQCDGDPKSRKIYDALMDWANDEINDGMNTHFEGFVP